MSTADRQKQLDEAEELLGDRLQRLGFVQGLFFGQIFGEKLLPYPRVDAHSPAAEMVAKLGQFCLDEIDPVAIDRDARIPDRVIRGLGELGVLGACLPPSCGGRGLSQTEYCRVIELLGGHCASTALFVNAHHSIGPRAIVLFGSEQQQQTYLPKLATGEWISAFALTEQEAGSDAANVQTLATPTPDGLGFVLNGQKRWITNGGIAQVLTVMARTPAPGGRESKITAFLVTPDMPGFRVVEERMPKCGVRGTATSRLAFENMYVPRENVLGTLGKGLKVALTVLDFGRTTFGASCTGAAKFCLARARRHATTRIQFQQPLGSFELVQEKVAYMAAGAFAMEAMTYVTAALIDSGAEDYMLETALLKVFATDTLWKIINDTIQIHGGQAYFTDQPFERMMRDARINMIGEGANDVLRVFAALVGMRAVGLELKSILEAASHPLRNLAKLGGFAGRRLEAFFASPSLNATTPQLEAAAGRFGKISATFGAKVEWLLRQHRESIVDRQFQLGRIADAAMELYASACVIRRLESLYADEDHAHHSASHSSLRNDAPSRPASRAEQMVLEREEALSTGVYYLTAAERRIRQTLDSLTANDDSATATFAQRLLRP